MPLTEDQQTNLYSITAYEDDFISVSDKPYRDSFIVSPAQLTPWQVLHVDQLNEDALSPIMQMQPEVVLIGTGLAQHFPSPQIFAHFSQQGIGLEVMANSAACRTFNILAAEDRNVVCGFILG